MQARQDPWTVAANASKKKQMMLFGVPGHVDQMDMTDNNYGHFNGLRQQGKVKTKPKLPTIKEVREERRKPPTPAENAAMAAHVRGDKTPGQTATMGRIMKGLGYNHQ